MGRRALHWNRIRGARGWAALAVGTALGAGLAPFAPGTFGTLVGVPLAAWSSAWPLEARVPFWIALFALGTWACAEFDRLMETGDNQNLVIDEVVGVAITGWFASGWKQWLTAFVLFRIFDIVKLPPVRQVDRWSKTASTSSISSLRGGTAGAWLDGFGVMADDAVAGVQGLIVMELLRHFGIL